MVGILNSIPRSGNCHLAAFVYIAVVERYTGSCKHLHSSLGSEVFGPSNAFEGNAVRNNNPNLVLAYKVTEEYLVSLAVGKYGVAVLARDNRNGLNTICARGNNLHTTYAIHKDANSTM